MILYLVGAFTFLIVVSLGFVSWKRFVPEKVKKFLIQWYEGLKPSAQCHLKTIAQLVITLVFSLLPVIVNAMSEGSRSINWVDVLFDDLKSSPVFIYTPAFLAQFFILTFLHDFKKKDEINVIYKLALVFSFYSCFMGAMTYSGFVDRGVFDFGEVSSSLPSTVDWSIIVTTLLSWYYCTYKVTYSPKDSKTMYAEQEKKAHDKFDKVMNNA